MTSIDARLKFKALGNCLVNLPAGFILPILDSSNILVQQVIIKICQETNDDLIASVGWTGFTCEDSSTIELDPVFAKTLNVSEGSLLRISINLESLDQLQATSVELEPASSSDWELTELYAESIEDKFLAQVRCVSLNQVLIIRTNPTSQGNNSNIINYNVKNIKTVEKDVPFAKIGNQTELHVIPKIHNQPSKPTSFDKKRRSVSSRKSTSNINGNLEIIMRSVLDYAGKGITLYCRPRVEFVGVNFVHVTVISGPGTPKSASKVSEKEIEMGLSPNAFGNSIVAKLVQLESEDDEENVKIENSIKMSPLLAIALGIEDTCGELICIQSCARKNIKLETSNCEMKINIFIKDSSFTKTNNVHLSLGNANDKSELIKNRQLLIDNVKQYLADLAADSQVPLTNNMKLPIIEETLPFGGRLFISGRSKMANTKSINPWSLLDNKDNLSIKIKGDELIPQSRIQIQSNFDDVEIIGFEKEYKDIIKNLEYFVPTYLYGKSGSGKSLFSHKIQQIFFRRGYYVSLIDFEKDLDDPLYDEDSNQSKDKNKIFINVINFVISAAAWHSPSLIILENLDKIVPKKLEQGDSGTSDRLTEFIINKFQTTLKTRNIALLITGKSKDALNQLIFQKHVTEEEVHLKAPSKIQRQPILEHMLKKRFPNQCSNLTFLSDVVHETEGYYPTDFTILIDRVYHDLAAHGSESFTEDNFLRAIKGYTPTSLKGVKLQKSTGIKWSDIGGLTEVKKVLLDTLELPTKYEPIFKNCPLRLRSGILLYGYPGCGKTMLASAIASKTGLNFISVKGPEILNKYIGASEQSVRELFDRAQSAKPCILFFDEFDSIAPKRGHDSTGVTDRIVNQLLTQMDGAEGLDGVYILGATSRPDLIDSALLRPGRLDKSILCDLPDLKNRKDILNTVIDSNGFNMNGEIDLHEIASKTDGFTGADLQAVAYNAYLKSVHDVLDNKNFEEGTIGADVEKVKFKLITNEVTNNNDYRTLKRKELELVDKIENIVLNEKENSKTEIKKEEETIKPKIYIKREHLLSSLKDTKPSISLKELEKFRKIYGEFQDSKRPSEMKNADDNSTDVGVRSSLM